MTQEDAATRPGLVAETGRDLDPRRRPRNLILVLGDQLDHRSRAFDGFDPEVDAIWMAENEEEASHVWAHKLRLAFFFSAMRHFRNEARARGRVVHYHELGPRRSEDRGAGFREILGKDVRRLRPRRLILTEPGDHRVWNALESEAEEQNLDLEIRPDDHFYVGIDEFRAYAADRKNLVLEHFYRHLRKKHDVLMTSNGTPVGGRWNYDHDNRKAFGAEGPGSIKPPRRFTPDETTREVLDLVAKRFPDHPGSLERFDLPVTHDQAMALVRDFVTHRLADFGAYEDAMWSGEAFLHHSRLSAALNVKLVSPRYCVRKAVEAHEAGEAPINSVEGFVRQILGWRELVRGVYWQHMPGYAELNALDCGDRDVPRFFWDGETDMNCVAQAMGSLVRHAYTHHIPRLMVLGQLALLAGVHPKRFHRWHMAMYADAVDWVSLPNALGMSQYGDGGIVGTKPYCASGAYIDRMSNYCGECRYNPGKATGDDACPFTTLYWDFLARHRSRFRGSRRMALQVRNVDRKEPQEMKAIRKRAAELQERIDGGHRL